MAADKIHINNLQLQLPNGLGSSAFSLHPAPPCPASLSLTVTLSPDVIPSCVANDTQCGLGVDYSSLSKGIQRLTLEKNWDGPHELLMAVGEKVIENEVIEGVEVQLVLPRASLIAQSIGYSATFMAFSSKVTTPKSGPRRPATGTQWTGHIRGIRCMTIVGLRDYERKEKQWLEVDVMVKDYEQSSWDHLSFSKTVLQVGMGEDTEIEQWYANIHLQWLERSSYGTIEALIDDLAFHLLSQTPALQSPQSSITLHLTKPSALPFAVPGITIERTMEDYTKRASSSTLPSTFPENIAAKNSQPPGLRAKELGMKRIFVALGSNLGDRVSNIIRATDELGYRGVQMMRCSRLYESEPMYHEDQGNFINGVVEVSCLRIKSRPAP